MTDTTNGWPGKPGVPLNPEKDGWHWVKTEHGLTPWRWKENPESIMWEFGWGAGDGVISPAYFAALGPCTYLGPVLSPDEATALQARVAELERLAENANQCLKAALNDKDWPWDTDQHRDATLCFYELRATLEGKKDE